MKRALKSKIFILPTREGLVFLLIGVVLFIIALAYTHNLAFSAAAVFMSIVMISAFFTNNNLSMLEVRGVQALGGESGKAELKVSVFNKSRHQRFCLECSLAGFTSFSLNLEGGEGGILSIPLKGERGIYRYERLTLSTKFPFGLFRSWRNYRIPGRAFIYPRFKGALALPVSRGGELKGGMPSSLEVGSGSEEFFGHRRYREEDSLYRLDWKAYARKRGLWNKIFKDPSIPRLGIDYDRIPLKEREDKLEQMAKWIDQAESLGAFYKVFLEGANLPTEWGRGAKYFQDCMEALSVWENRERVLN